MESSQTSHTAKHGQHIGTQDETQTEGRLARIKRKIKKHAPAILATVVLAGIAFLISASSNNTDESLDDEPDDYAHPEIEPERTIHGLTQSEVTAVAQRTYRCDSATITNHGGIEVEWHSKSGKTQYSTLVQVEGEEHATAYMPVGPRENYTTVPSDFARNLQIEIDKKTND